MKKPISLITFCLLFGLFVGLGIFVINSLLIDNLSLSAGFAVVSGAVMALLMHVSLSVSLFVEKIKYGRMERAFGKKFTFKVRGLFFFRKLCSGAVYVFDDEIFIASLDCKPKVLLKISAREILGCRSNGKAVTIFADKGNILFQTPEADRLMREIHKICRVLFNV